MATLERESCHQLSANRFTEIWVEPIDFSTKEAEDLVATQLSWPRLARPMLDCVSWFNQRVLHPLSIREVLAWAAFVRSTAPEKAEKSLQASVERAVEMYLHGGCMTLVDSLGLGNQLVDTECIALYQKQTKDSQDENCGGLSVAQRAILWNLLCQLDRPEFFQDAWLDGASIRFEVLVNVPFMSHAKSSITKDLTSQGREKVQAVFSQGGFAWVQGPADALRSFSALFGQAV